MGYEDNKKAFQIERQGGRIWLTAEKTITQSMRVITYLEPKACRYSRKSGQEIIPGEVCCHTHTHAGRRRSIGAPAFTDEIGLKVCRSIEGFSDAADQSCINAASLQGSQHGAHSRLAFCKTDQLISIALPLECL